MSNAVPSKWAQVRLKDIAEIRSSNVDKNQATTRSLFACVITWMSIEIIGLQTRSSLWLQQPNRIK